MTTVATDTTVASEIANAALATASARQTNTSDVQQTTTSGARNDAHSTAGKFPQLLGYVGKFADPEQSPQGTEAAQPVSDAQRRFHEKLVATWAPQLYDATAEEILRWADAHIDAPIAVTMSMENTVLAELAQQYLHNARLVFLDTGFHFPETLETAEAVQQRYQIPLETVQPVLSVEQQNSRYGAALPINNPGACCRMRKVEPLAKALNGYSAWVTGLRRVDNPLRAKAPAIALDAQGRLKINPMIGWTLEDTQRYIEEHDLIVHPLTLRGYPSIGCAPCTRAVAEGEDPRAGRWQGHAKTECGLHT